MPRRSGGGVVSATSPDLYKLVKDLDQVDKKISREMKRDMRKGAEPIVHRVQAAAPVGKTGRIPRATKASTRFTKKTTNVIITVNARQAPHARPINNDDRPGFFEHPTPQGGTAKQRAVNFFYRPIVSSQTDMDRVVQRAADKAMRQAGFR